MVLRETSQKERILHAAAELFARHGYHGVGMSQLEKAVGLQRGALYHHIGNKEALLYEISVSQLRVMVESAQKISAAFSDEEERIRALARAILRNIAEHRLEWTVHYRDFNALTGERLRDVLDLRAQYERAWLDAFHTGTAKGLFRSMADDVAFKGILGMFNYSYVWMDQSGRVSTDTIADMFCDIILSGIRPPQAVGGSSA
ncbi:TetR family transcriptional regulator [Actinocorallia herbida]|uniref:TetR family transcriptional regulator n=1 Tax=Actinocorallia herbida TaxID=58109 RepID=A0A3N1D0L2_9ACTN|nr:TetR/AcrR family transcriptional regulator [Actinocorallia herbida]ROO87062.1 TetR family transcriptional regulator [Actinocorallia herbida]